MGPDAAVGEGGHARAPAPSIWPIMNAQSCPGGIARFTAEGLNSVRPLVSDTGQGGLAGCDPEIGEKVIDHL